MNQCNTSDRHDTVQMTTAPGSPLPYSALLLLLVGLLACGSPRSPEHQTTTTFEEWIEARHTDGSLTTVITTSGSRWAGPASLELESSIGVSEGDWRYMLTRPVATSLHENLLYILDEGESRVSVFDRRGNFVRSFGRGGPGPSEFTSPENLVISQGGTVLVLSSKGPTLSVQEFDPLGLLIDTWLLDPPGERMRAVAHQALDTELGLAVGLTKLPVDIRRQGVDTEYGIQISRDGRAFGSPRFAPLRGQSPPTLRLQGASGFILDRPVPFSVGRPTVAVAHDGSFIWGYGTEYSFRIERPDGRIILVQRRVEPVPVMADEAEYYRQLVETSYRRRNPSFSWDGKSMPRHKPWFEAMYVDRDNNIWVMREVVGSRDADCLIPNTQAVSGERVSCWRRKYQLDAFDLDGTFLGSADWPEDVDPIRAISFGESRLVGYHETQNGTPTIRVYRIILP